MVWKKKPNIFVQLYSVFLILIGVHTVTPSRSQNENKPESSWSDEQWEKAREGLNYEEKLKEPKKKEKTNETDRVDSSSWNMKESLTNIFNSDLGKFISIALIVGLLVFALFKLLIDKRTSGSKKIITAALSENYDGLEENLPETDLERFLRLALENGDYKLAIRILFLTTVQKLDELKLIHWKKDKTNLDYLREMRQNDNYARFKELTIAYEIIWYGDTTITSETYQKLNPIFKNYANQLANDGNPFK